MWIRKVQRPDRFRGSHLEEADRILLMITAIVVAAAVAGDPGGARARPRRRPHHRGARRLDRRCVERHPRGAERCSSGCTCCSCSASSSTCQAPSICTSSPRRPTCGSRRGRRADTDASAHRPRGPEEEMRFGAGGRQRPHEADARPLLVHGMRPLPGRLPRVDHGEPLSPKLLIMGPATTWRPQRQPASLSCSPSCRTRSPTRSSGTA